MEQLAHEQVASRKGGDVGALKREAIQNEKEEENEGQLSVCSRRRGIGLMMGGVQDK